MRRLLIFLILLAVIGSPIAFVVTAMEPTPTVGVPPAPQPADAARTKGLLKNLRQAVKSEDTQQQVTISKKEIDSAFIVAARVLPVRGEARISADAATINISTGIPRVPLKGWLNIAITVLPAEGELRVASIKVGPYALPPSLVTPALGLALDLALGDDLGRVALASVDRVSMRSGRVSLGFTMSSDDKEAMLAATKDRVRQGSPFGSEGDVREYYLALDKAAVAGQLPRNGSFAPYVRFAYQSALDSPIPGDEMKALRSAFLALAVYCGERKLQSLVGKVVPEAMMSKRSHCTAVTLAGRTDLRQHFIVSAALKLASDSGLAFAIGEFKELLDANRGGSGFSFDDIAADRAGIRFAEVVFGSDPVPANVGKQLGTLSKESVIFPRISGLPAGLTSAEFKRKFGNADSPAYRKMLANIDNRIDQLAFYSTP